MIKIKNIYYMLTYVFKVLNQTTYSDISFEKFEHIYDLLSAILARGITSQMKHNIDKDYINKIDMISVPRGKIDIKGSLNQVMLRNKKLCCEFD